MTVTTCDVVRVRHWARVLVFQDSDSQGLLSLYLVGAEALFSLAQNAPQPFSGRPLPEPTGEAYNAPTNTLAGLRVWPPGGGQDGT